MSRGGNGTTAVPLGRPIPPDFPTGNPRPDTCGGNRYPQSLPEIDQR